MYPKAATLADAQAQCPHVSQFATRAVDSGQIVAISYAETPCYLFQRVFDASDRSVYVDVYRNLGNAGGDFVGRFVPRDTK